jgi:hypothetical protein
MQSHANNTSVATRLAVLIFGVTICSSGLFAFQSHGSAMMTLSQADGTVAHYRTYPENAVKLLFPKGEAMVEPDASAAN